MPRQADPELPDRILKAADRLWQDGGEEAVTIRGVAAAAATTTPTVYSYFESREALLQALRTVAFARFTAYVAKSTGFEDSCARHLEFGERYARDYELLYGRNWLERVTAERQAEELGGFTSLLVASGVDPARAEAVAFPVLMMLHGVIMHRLSNRKPSALSRRIKTACLAACKSLLDNALSATIRK